MMSMIGSLPIDTRFEHREGVLYGEGGFTSVDEEFAHGVEASGDGTIDFDVHVTIFFLVSIGFKFQKVSRVYGGPVGSEVFEPFW